MRVLRPHPATTRRRAPSVRLLVLALAVVLASALLSAVPAPRPAAAAEPADVLRPGEDLLPHEAVVSPNDQWALYLGDGVLSVEGLPSWLDRDGWSGPLASGVARVVLRTDGDLVALGADGSTVWSTRTAGRGVAGLTVLDGGRVVLFDGRGAEVLALGRTTSVLEPGDALLPGDQVRSPSGTGLLAMQHDGNLVFYRGGRPQWSSGSAGNPGAGALFQADGNLVVYTSPTVGVRAVGQTGPRAALQPRLRVEDHEVSLVDVARDLALWGTAWSQSELAPGDALQPGDRRTTRDGRCVLTFQGDLNLVEYCGGRPVWATGTSVATRPPEPGRAQLVMQRDGNLVLYGWAGTRPGPRWYTGTSVAGSRLVLQTDANLVVYGPDGRPTWSRTTGRLR